MKKLLLSKKGIIIICTILATILCFSSFAFLKANGKNNDNLTQTDQSSIEIAGGNGDASLLSSTTLKSNAIIYYHEDLAKDRIKKIIKARSLSNTQISVKEIEHAFFISTNLDQTDINKKFKKEYSIDVTNTCALISIEILADIIMKSDFVNINYPQNLSQEELQLTIIKELYDIAIKLGNNYTGSNAGTKVSTKDDIIHMYFANHGYDFTVTNETIDSTGDYDYLRDNLINACVTPAALSMDKFYLESRFLGNDARHSVAVVGGYHFQVSYKKTYNLRDTLTRDFYALVICDGWKAYDVDGSIGTNHQLLVIEDDAESFYLNNVYGWLPNE